MGRQARAEVLHAEDADCADVGVGPEAALAGPGPGIQPAGQRVELAEQAKAAVAAQLPEPGAFAAPEPALVVALVGHHRDAGAGQPLQRNVGGGVGGRLDGLGVEQVTGDDHEVGRDPQAVVDRVVEGADEVGGAFGQPVLAEAQVDVREVDEADRSVAHGWPSDGFEGATRIPNKKRTKRWAYARPERARGLTPCN